MEEIEKELKRIKVAIDKIYQRQMQLEETLAHLEKSNRKTFKDVNATFQAIVGDYAETVGGLTKVSSSLVTLRIKQKSEELQSR